MDQIRAASILVQEKKTINHTADCSSSLCTKVEVTLEAEAEEAYLFLP